MPFVRKNKERETLALIYMLLKIAQLHQVRLQSFWLGLGMNCHKDFSEKSTEEVDSLRMVSSPWVEWLTRTTEGLLEFDYSILQIFLTRSKLEIVSPNMQSTRSRTANGRRLRNYQRLTEEKTDSEVVGNRIINQIYLLIIDTMWIYYLIIYFVGLFVTFLVNLGDLTDYIQTAKAKKASWMDIEGNKYSIIIGYFLIFTRPILAFARVFVHISDLVFIFWKNDKKAK